MEKLLPLLHDLENAIPGWETVHPPVSQASVGWHIEHSLLVMEQVAGALQRSRPEDYRPKFNWKKLFLFTMRTIPKGRIKSPKAVQPLHFDQESLYRHLEQVRQVIPALSLLERDQHFVHPFLGHFNLKDAATFLEIHTRHHLGIIGQILKEARVKQGQAVH